MSFERDMLIESAVGVVARHTEPESPESGWNARLWEALHEVGFTLVALDEDAGGSGGELADAAAIARVAGASAARVPLAESMLVGGWLLAEARLPLTGGPVTAGDGSGLEATRDDQGWQVRGRLPKVPWGRFAGTVAALVTRPDGDLVLALDPALATLEAGENLAGEPRDDLIVDVEVPASVVAPAPAGVDAPAVARRGALARALTMAGALDRVLALTIQYVGEREQFGRPIGRFQAVQHELAALAGEVTATSAAVDAAVEAESRGAGTQAVAVAKARAGMAAGRSAAIAHQLHGAIGFTDEHELHRHTLRLWSWRDEFGTEDEWAARLARSALGNGPAGVWTALTTG